MEKYENEILKIIEGIEKTQLDIMETSIKLNEKNNVSKIEENDIAKKRREELQKRKEDFQKKVYLNWQ